MNPSLVRKKSRMSSSGAVKRNSSVRDFTHGSMNRLGSRTFPEQIGPPLHQICTKFPQILLIVVITVAQTDVMLDRGRQGNALWTLSRVRRAA